MMLNARYKHTDSNGVSFVGVYVGGPVTLDLTTGKQGDKICLYNERTGSYKWVLLKECKKV